jgi:hypothetical protein
VSNDYTTTPGLPAIDYLATSQRAADCDATARVTERAGPAIASRGLGHQDRRELPSAPHHVGHDKAKEILMISIRPAIADDAQQIGGVFDAAVGEGWPYHGGRLRRGVLIYS